MLSPWPHVRAGLIAAALFFGGLSGIPEPAKRYLDHVPDFVRTVVETFESGRQAILRPVRFVPEFFQFTEEWRLFGSASGARLLMWIEAREGVSDPWRVLYRPHDAEHAWLAETLEYRRVRGNWNPSRQGPSRGYDGFVRWVARRAFAEHPEFRSLRVRMEEIRILPEGEGFERMDRFLHERVIDRSAVQP